MHVYEEYFDKGMRGEPYSSAEEEREDYLRLLDMILESCLEYKGLHTQKKLYSRGLLITETELAGYFEMPPGLRERDIPDPVLAECVREAFDHIEERASHTQDSSKAEGAGSIKPVSIGDIRKIFDLDRNGLLTVLLAFACATDRRYERIFGFLQDDVTLRDPTLGLLYMIIRRITRREAGENVPLDDLDEKLFLFFFRPAEDMRADTPIVLNPAMRELLSVGEIGDDRLTGSSLKLFKEESDIPVFFDENGKELKKILKRKGLPIVFIENSDPETVFHLLSRFLDKGGERLYVLNPKEFFLLPAEKRDDLLSALAIRLKLKKGRVAVRSVSAEEWPRLRQIIDKLSGCSSDGTIFIFGEKTEPAWISLDGVPAFRISEPDTMMRIKMWEYFLGTESSIRISEDVVIPDLADCHKLSYGMIKKICVHALAEAKLHGMKKLDKQTLLSSLKQMNMVDFSSVAVCVNTAYSWEDITLDTSQLEILHVACDRYRLRNRVGEKWGLKKKNVYGNGVSILLYGPPGTGKTMAAQVIANELSLPLYRVDISRIFSKYIGETEKNLSAVFDVAAGTDVILFFDEADALFSKRTEISGSNDKYSNSETAYLLQKIEEYDGMSILATNYYKNFDNAFVRRITYAVHLDSPDEESRYKLWSSILPEETEVDEDIDFRLLARQFTLSGSNIKSILYSAAFMAGAQGKPLGMEHIAKALQYEYRKQGRLIDTAEFGPLMIYL